MEDRQTAGPESQPKPRTLISSLRRALAAQAGCDFAQIVSCMWATLSSTAFDDVDEIKMIKLVRGETFDTGMKRVF